MVYVSHALEEVTRLATSLVVLEAGRVAAAGPVAEVFQRMDLSAIIGARDTGALIEATVVEHDDRYGLRVLASIAGTWRFERVGLSVGERVRLRVRASDVMLSTLAPTGVSALNVFEGRIVEVGAADGAGVQVRLDCGGDVLLARLTRYSLDTLGITVGTTVFALIKSVAMDTGWEAAR